MIIYNKMFLNLFKISVICILFAYCTKAEETTSSNSSNSSNSTTTTTTTEVFRDTMGILPVLSKCAGSTCHSVGATGKGVSEWVYNPNDYTNSIKKYISSIYKQASVYGAGMASSQYANLSQTEVNTLVAWYQAGAPNGKEPVTTITTSNVTFDNYIKTSVLTKCTGCHGGSGGVSYSGTYADLVSKKVKFNSTIQNGSMPQGAPLAAADRALVQAWIDRGTPEK